MLITELGNPTNLFDFVGVYNKSPRYFSLVSNMMKRRFGVSSDAMLLRKDLNDLVKDGVLLSVPPLFSRYWFIVVDDQTKEVTPDTVSLIARLPYVKFLVGASNYRIFQHLRYLKGLGEVKKEFMFGSFLSQAEFDLLYQSTVRASSAETLSDDLLSFVKKRYLRSPESVFELLASLRDGIPFSNRNDIVKLLGVGSLQVEMVALSLVTSTARTERGLKQFLKKQGQTLVELGLKSSPNSVRLRLVQAFKGILLLKSHMLEGRILVGVGELPDLSQYKNTSLTALSRRLDSIEGVSQRKVVAVLGLLEGSRWSSDLDYFEFLYGLVGLLSNPQTSK